MSGVPSEYTVQMSSSVTDELGPREDRFFNRVKREPTLVEVLERHGFNPPKPYERVVNKRESLRFEKPSWLLPRPKSALDTVKLYYESVYRGDLRLRVDLDPHRERNADLLSEQRNEQREVARERRAKLLEQIRKKLLTDPRVTEHLAVTTRSLRRPERPFAMTAVKFDLHLTEDCSAEECAQAYAQAIDLITPIVDRLLTARRRG
jgi:hypothetical protein